MKKNGQNETLEAHQLMESTLDKEGHVVGYFSCGPALSTKVDGESDDVPGLAFWVIFDWPEYGIGAFENYLSKLILDILSCKADKGRSKFIINT